MNERITNRNLKYIASRVKEGHSFDSAGDVIMNVLNCGVILLEFKDGKTEIIYHNDALYNIMGKKETTPSMPFHDIIDFLCPRDQMALIMMTEQTLLKGEPMSIEVLGIDENGNDNWIHINAQPVDFIETDGVAVLAVVSNVTADKQKYLENAINYERYLMLQNAAAKSVYFEYDNKKDIIMLNRKTANNKIETAEIEDYSVYAKETNLVYPDDRKLFFGTLAKACSRAKKGDFRYRTMILDRKTYKWARNSYISIADSNGSVVRIIGRIDDIDDEEREKERTARLIEFDSTTGVYNKPTAAAKIQKAIEENRNKKDFFAIVDLDDFKACNDTHGHSFGDEVLLAVANVLNTAFPDGIVGRFGGDEFILYVVATDEKKIVEKFESCLRRLEKMLIRGEKHEIKCSVGVIWSEQGGNYTDYFEAADGLLYKAKNSGKNKVLCEKFEN